MFSSTRRTYEQEKKFCLLVKKKVNKISYGSLNPMCNETFLQFHAAQQNADSFVDRQSPVAFLHRRQENCEFKIYN